MKTGSLRRIIGAVAAVSAFAGAALPGNAAADIITFDFTGRLTVADLYGGVISNSSAARPGDPNGWQTPISASLTYDTSIGVSSSTLTVSMGDFWGSPATLHGISTLSTNGTLIDAQVLGDWNGNYNMPAHVQWDATGLINAINFGLQVGDKLSGNYLYRDANGNGTYEATELLTTLGSATPYSDSLMAGKGVPLQGSAPLAATAATQGFTSGPFTGIHLYLDIGSGNSMYVTSVTPVPVPAAVWLLGSGLLGLLGVTRRKRG